MPDLTVSADVDAMMSAANNAAIRTAIGLGNVDNTSDAGKPVSTLQAAAIAAAQAASQPLDADLTSWAAVVRAAGFDTFAATPNEANLAALLTSALPDSKGGTGLTALGAGIATVLATAINSVGGIQTKLYQEWNAEEVTLYNSGSPNISTAGTSSYVGVQYTDGASTYIQFPVSASRWAGRSVKMKMLLVGSTTEASKAIRLRLGIGWRTTALDGTTTEAAGPGVGMGGGSEENIDYAVSWTANRLLMATSTTTWNIASNATFIGLFFGMERANAGDTYAGTVWSILFMLEEQ